MPQESLRPFLSENSRHGRSRTIPSLRSRRLWLDVAAAFAVIAGATLISLAVIAAFGSARTGIIFLTAVMLVGATRGLRPSLLAAVLATISYNYFLAGLGFQFQLPSDDEFHSLVLFSVAAFITGNLTGRLRASELSALRRLTVVETLLEVERRAEGCAEEALLFKRVTAAVAAGLPTLCLRITPAGAPGDEAGGATRAIMSGQEKVAVLAWVPGPAEFEEFIDLLADRVESHIDRLRASQISSRLQLERGRNLMLASVSHDFRTPLATIIAATSSLMDLDGGADRKTRLRLLGAALAEAERLDAFVSQLLEAMRRSPDGVMVVAAGSVDVIARLRDLADRFNGAAGWIQVEVSGDPCWVRADETLFAQAFSNIIENAVKYGQRDTAVGVSVRQAGSRVAITVEDSGPGVPEADLAGIFERDRQVGSIKKRSGYGIGLAVARFNVNAMGGDIRAANKPTGGLQVIAEFAGGVDGEGY